MRPQSNSRLTLSISPVSIDLSVVKLRACAALKNGSVTCWTFNDQQDAPANVTPVQGLDSVAGVTLGGEHSCARRNDNSVWCWGHNDHGQLGTGTIGTVGQDYPPAPVPGISAIAVSAGVWHTCAVLDGGQVQCWGWNLSGAIGTPEMLAQPIVSTPQAVPDLPAARPWRLATSSRARC
jgi:alpha-tubulin suppressor-like RCC1 family protein